LEVGGTWGGGWDVGRWVGRGEVGGTLGGGWDVGRWVGHKEVGGVVYRVNMVWSEIDCVSSELGRPFLLL